MRGATLNMGKYIRVKGNEISRYLYMLKFSNHQLNEQMNSFSMNPQSEIVMVLWEVEGNIKEA